VNPTSPKLQNFHNSFAARPYWKMTSSTPERSEFTGAEPIDSLTYMFDQVSQPGLVIRRDRCPGLSPTEPPAIIRGYPQSQRRAGQNRRTLTAA
jgi:hypothetical protein